MRLLLGLLLLSALASGCDARAVSTAAAATSAAAGDAVVVELFTSEGCSSCPPADERLSALDRDGVSGTPVLVLGLHVDYWDELGWKDSFGSPAWTARQRAYSRAFGRGNVYTPEAVVDGATEVVGSDADGVSDLVRRAAGRPKASVTVSRAHPGTSGALELSVRVARLPPVTPGDTPEVIAAVTEDHVVDDVRRGENAGKRLALAPVTLSLDVLGSATEGGVAQGTLRLPPRSESRALRVVAFVQERASRRVLGAGSMRL